MRGGERAAKNDLSCSSEVQKNSTMSPDCEDGVTVKKMMNSRVVVAHMMR